MIREPLEANAPDKNRNNFVSDTSSVCQRG